MLQHRKVSLSLCAVRTVLLALVVMSAWSCGGGGGTATTPPPPVVTPPPPPPPPPPAGLLMKVASAQVPPGGMFQFQLLLTEPKPLSHASTQPNVPTSTLGTVRGIAVNDPSGQATGVAVINGSSIDITMSSANFTLGTDVSYPLFTMTMPVLPTATPGVAGQVSLSPSSAFFDSTGAQNPIQELLPGTLTVGGTISITDVIPGGGLVPAGSTVRVLGVGFTPTTKIQLPDPIVTVTTNFISSSEIDVTFNTAVQLDGERVRAVQPPSPNEVVEYYSYLRGDPAPGTSANALVTQMYPLFSQQTYNKATVPLNRTAPKFTALALQNTSTSAASVTLDLLDSGGAVVATLPLSLAARTRIVRAVVEDWFPSAPVTAVTVRATSKVTALQMLGLLGDSSAATVSPVTPTAVP